MKLNKKEIKWLKIVLAERLSHINENLQNLPEFELQLYYARVEEENESLFSICKKLIKE
jgi:hypothetical protein